MGLITGSQWSTKWYLKKQIRKTSIAEAYTQGRIPKSKYVKKKRSQQEERTHASREKCAEYQYIHLKSAEAQYDEKTTRKKQTRREDVDFAKQSTGSIYAPTRCAEQGGIEAVNAYSGENTKRWFSDM